MESSLEELDQAFKILIGNWICKEISLDKKQLKYEAQLNCNIQFWYLICKNLLYILLYPLYLLKYRNFAVSFSLTTASLWSNSCPIYRFFFNKLHCTNVFGRELFLKSKLVFFWECYSISIYLWWLLLKRCISLC